MRNTTKTKLQLPRLMKPVTQKSDVPFEKYQHFVVAPPRPHEHNHEKLYHSVNLTKPKPLETQESVKSVEIEIPDENQNHEETGILVNQKMTPFEVSISEEELDSFILQASNSTIHEATEKFILDHFHGETCVYWENIPELQVLYSPTFQIITGRDESMASSAFFMKSLIRTNSPRSHPAFSKRVDLKFAPDDNPMIVFPLWDYKGALVAVVQIVRPLISHEFSQEDENYALKFATKFRTFSKFILTPQNHEQMLLQLVQLRPFDQLLTETVELLQNYFESRVAEIWRYDVERNLLALYGSNKEIEPNEAGIVGSCVGNLDTQNIASSKQQPSYNENIDGNNDEPVLINPVQDPNDNFVFFYVLRGPKHASLYQESDVLAFRKLTSFSAMSIANADRFTSMSDELINTSDRSQGLAALLEVAEVLSGQLDIAKLTEAIMEKGRSLTKSDRCSLFLVNDKRDKLITSFQHGLDNAIIIPIDKGIAGRTVKEKATIRIADAYSDPSFDSSTDLETGYRTQTILSVPIFNNRGEVIGVTEMVNKMKGEFTEWDAHMIRIFNVFCGISLENARLYKDSVDMSQQLHSFFDVSFSLSNSQNIKAILGDIIKNARVTIEAQCGSLLIVDETANCLTSFLVDGGKIPSTLPLTTGICGAAVTQKECIVANHVYDDPRFNRTIDIENNFKTDSLLVAPIISSKGEVIGVVEMVNKQNGEFDDNDVKLLKSFAGFAAVSLENQRLKSIADLGDAEVELPKYIADTERLTSTTPAKLVLSDEDKKCCSSLNFLCIEWKGVKQIKLLFYLFDKFNILKNFKITNEMFFHFVFAIRDTYNDVPYHNWTHACDVCEYVAYEISTAKLDTVLTPLELFAMMVAAVCHDANHDGFNNVFNVKAATPLGILFKDQSVMETHHCEMAIQILTKEEYNLMHSLNQEKQRTMWTWIIQLILATDMAFHFKFVKDTSALIDNNEFSMDNPEHRLLAMKLLLKVGDISNVSRPFAIADKWCDVLNEEFFRQGDNEKSLGLELTSPLNDREHPDKPKSQIGFYNFVCLPLYQVVARLFPPLQVNLESVKSNLEVWKSMMPPPPPTQGEAKK